MKRTIFVTVLNDPKYDDYGYKYILEEFGDCRNGFGRTAFRTDRGYALFCDMYGLSKPKRVVKFSNNKCSGKTYFLEGNFEVVSFWKKSDIPLKAKKFIGLCNGSYVECYSIKQKDGSHLILKPNPNAKSVYKPLDYFKCSKIWG